MGEIKSAFEKAMEKVEKMGKASEEDLSRWKYVPEGEKLAARYLKDECDLSVEVGKYDSKVKSYVVQGVQEVLVRSIELPRNDTIKKRNKKVMDALKGLKRDKVALENVFSNIRRISGHYEQQGEQQKKQAYESLKRDFEVKMRQAMQQQMGTVPAGMKMDVERQPQFQEEWRRVQVQFDSQYLKVLDEYRQQILSVS